MILRLHKHSGDTVFINSDYVTYFEPDELNGGTNIRISGKRVPVMVKENAKKVTKMMNDIHYEQLQFYKLKNYKR